MGGFIAQALAVKYADRVDKLVLLSTDPGGIEADLASPDVWSELVDTSGTPNEQARRLLFLLFPTDIVAAARAQLSVELLNRQAATMDAWHRNGVAGQPREIRAPVLIATGTEDIVIPASNALKTRKRNSRRLSCSIPSRRPCLNGAVSTSARRCNQQFSRS